MTATQPPKGAAPRFQLSGWSHSPSTPPPGFLGSSAARLRRRLFFANVLPQAQRQRYNDSALERNMPVPLFCPRATPFDAGAHAVYAASDETATMGIGKGSEAGGEERLHASQRWDRESTSNSCEKPGIGAYARGIRSRGTLSGRAPLCIRRTYTLTASRVQLLRLGMIPLAAGFDKGPRTMMERDTGFEAADPSCAPAEPLFHGEDQGTRASIPLSKARIRASPFPSPEPFSSRLRSSIHSVF
ncbi:hypothetical protein B0H19DRAFT_1262030 [Mycena capillaripes]|nr:hypothetical protein B0H19DRAFT_1262030 [Mycena capillaripes]